MENEWPRVALASCASFQEGYVNPPQKTDLGYFGGPIKWLRATDLNNGFVHETSRTLTKKGFESAGTAALLFERNKIGISKAGTIGRVGILKDYMCGNRAVISVKVHDDVADTRFVFYILIYNNRLLQNLAIGSVQPNLYTSALGSLELDLPPLPEQKAIAHILGTLDDKIELNRQMNETLEAMAQALFKSWFVDFDPVIDNALEAGNPIPEALASRAETRRQVLADGRADRKTAKLFPDAFQFTEGLGWIPEGWELVDLKQITSKIGSGATPRGGSKVYVDEGISLIRSQNVFDSQFKWNGLARITTESADELSNVEVEFGDILFNITGASVMRTCVVPASVLPARVNQHVLIIRAKSANLLQFLHLHLVNPQMKARLSGLNAGATREALTKGHLEAVQVGLPQPRVLEEFQARTDSIFQRAELSETESTTLANIRNALLPELISGELVVHV